MTYFQLYNLKPTLSIDKSNLKQKYYALSKEFHPDLNTQNTSIDYEQKTIEINKAFKTLSNENLLIKYFLEQHHFLLENDNTVLPQNFLMEMMELNEEFLETSSIEEKTLFMEKLNLIQKKLKNNIQFLLDKESIENIDNTELVLLKNYYLQNKYIDKIINQ